MIELKPFQKDDFSSLISWINNENDLVQFAGAIFTFPLTNNQLNNYLKDLNRHAFKVIYKLDNSIIGHSEIYINKNKTAKLCRILIGNPKFRGKGLGQKIVKELVHISFDNYNEKIVHAEGKLIFENNSNNKIINDEKIPIKELKRKCGNPKTGDYFYNLFNEAGFKYGPAFRTVQEFYVNSAFALSKLKIAGHLKEDFNQFILHPSILDGALQTVAGLIGEVEPSTPYLPFAIDEIELIKTLVPTCYAYVEFSNSEKKTEKNIKKFNIKLLNEEGDVLLKLNGFYARALGKSE